MPSSTPTAEARGALDLAARLASRAMGNVEPNPLVGCVLLRPGPEPWRERVIGLGHHERFGQAHAEVLALQDARARGHDPAGCTAFVTLEPCNHFGKQPPCVQALIAARVARVVCARRDPNPVAAGGADALRAAGIACEFTAVSPLATRLCDAFATNITDKRPFVIAKWAQSIDGKVATQSGESRWISNPRSRRSVHHLRARVDAIMAGIGTVLADDPRLTARGVPVRRVATRVIVDPSLRIPDSARLFEDLPASPITIITAQHASEQHARRADALRRRGVRIIHAPPSPASSPALRGEAPAWRTLDLRSALGALHAEHAVSTLMVEGGPRLMGSLLDADLIDEARVYIGALLMGDTEAADPIDARPLDSLKLATRFSLLRSRELDGDVMAVWRRATGQV